MTGRDTLITADDSLEAIGNGRQDMFGANHCSILVRDAHIRNRRRTNNRRERFNPPCAACSAAKGAACPIW